MAKTDRSLILVDTNVISDVVHADPVWSQWAMEQLNRYAGSLVISPMVFGELCYHAESLAEVESLVEGFGLIWEEPPREALFLASKVFRLYRERGGVKTAPLPDFFIGAHAQSRGRPLLTRDAARYRTYFPGVPLVSP